MASPTRTLRLPIMCDPAQPGRTAISFVKGGRAAVYLSRRQWVRLGRPSELRVKITPQI